MSKNAMVYYASQKSITRGCRLAYLRGLKGHFF